MSTPSLVLRYVAFALIATLINLATQRLVLAVLPPDAVGFTLALLAGTATGLVAKYWLDKNWIFFDTSAGMAAHGRKFGLYTVMGIVTTLIFWGMETGFWLAWRTEAMREVGALVGLGIGYVVKYHLDRRFVFEDRRSHD